MRLLSALTVPLVVTSCVALAQSPVTLVINTQNSEAAIPDDFSGLSFEMGSLRSGNAGTLGNMFDDSTHWPAITHSQMMLLFRELGIKNIRMGGGSVDMNNIVPTTDDIDAFFRFVKAMHLRVIYSVRLLNGNITDDTMTVKYVWNNYGQFIDCFAIGNEPDWKSYHTQDPAITDYPSYLAQWRTFAAAIVSAAPEVTFGGPDTGSNYPVPGATSTNYLGYSWTVLFANDVKTSGIVTSIFAHNYVGQGATGNTAQQMIDKMLSTTWVTSYYPALYNACCAPVLAAGFPYRLTESNSFSGAVPGGSNSFATALFALDYMHWWAEHHAAGINFHNKQWVGNGPITMDANQYFRVYPIAYGIKAFDLGGHGLMDSLEITNPNAVNLTAYAVQDTASLYVTIINKEHGPGARDAAVAIAASGWSDSATVMYLMSPNGATDTTGVTLGGAAISSSSPWQGTWSPIDSVRTGEYYALVPASSAAIVRINGAIASVAGESNAPDRYRLFQNYPNPFNPATEVRYSASVAGTVHLAVYDLLGRKVAVLVNERKPPGSYTVTFDASHLAGGVYFCRLEAGNSTSTIKMVLLK